MTMKRVDTVLTALTATAHHDQKKDGEVFTRIWPYDAIISGPRDLVGFFLTGPDS
jgi:hypothetical protein